MNTQHFGDSYDIVKRALIGWLGGHWVAHLMVTDDMKDEDLASLEGLLGAQSLVRSRLTTTTDRAAYLQPAREHPGNVFLDPDTGVLLEPEKELRRSPKHVFGEELTAIALAPGRGAYLTMVFDQSMARGEDKAKALGRKLAYFAERRVYGAAYVSHACFLILGAEVGVVQAAVEKLRTHLPETRLLVGPGFASPAAPARPAPSATGDSPALNGRPAGPELLYVPHEGLQRSAARLQPLMERAVDPADRDPLDYVLGAIQALFLAVHLEYQDRPQALDDQYWVEGPLQRVRHLRSGRVRTNGKWLAGFYFNSAMARIAGAFHRIVCRRAGADDNVWKLLETLNLGNRTCEPKTPCGTCFKCRAVSRVYREVNPLKHAPIGLAAGRRVSLDDASISISDLLDLCVAPAP